MQERWEIIKGFENYEISNMGRVRTVNTHILKVQSGGNGTNGRYKYVTLYKNNRDKKVRVHRLVGLHFIPNPNNYPYVLHIKDDRSKNTVNDLKWGTQLQNRADCAANGIYSGPKNPIRGNDQWNAKLNPQKVRQIREIRDSGVWVSQESLAARFGISRGTLRSILKNKHWTHVK